jgi:hypothetical protein
MKHYEPVEMSNLDIIRKKVLDNWPSKYDFKPALIYFPEKFGPFEKIDELWNEVSKLSLYDKVIRVGCHNSLGNGPIHIDLEQYEYSLNIPIANTENSIVNFFESDKEPTLMKAELGKNPFPSWKREDCKLIDKFVLDKPHIMKTNVPHQVCNMGINMRKVLLIRLHQVGKLF